MDLILAEKPSLHSKIANALGCHIRKGSYTTNSNGSIVVTYQFGHMFELYDVKDYELGVNSKEKLSWNKINLPYYKPFKFKLKNDKGVYNQYKEISKLIKNADRIIHAGDPDREGQILGDIVLDQLGVDITKIKRLWLPQQVESEIKKAYDNLEDNKKYMNMHKEGMSRLYMDWLLGINTTVYSSIKSGQFLRVGRVLIPIVKYIYDRDMAIKNFKPEKYYQNENDNVVKLVCKEKFKNSEDAIKQKDYLNSNKVAKVTYIDNKEVSKAPPKLFSLSDLQNQVTKKLGLSAQKSMPIIQSLYEKGLITYPRTPTQYLGENEKDMVKKIIKSHDTKNELRFRDVKSIFDSSKIESHSAITITTLTDTSKLSDLELKVYNIVKNRFFANFCAEDCKLSRTVMKVNVGDYEFNLKGDVVVNPGWMKFESFSVSNNLPNLKLGDTFNINFKDCSKVTEPPKAVTQIQLMYFLKHPLKKGVNDVNFNDDFDNDDKDNVDNSDIDDSKDYKDLLNGIMIGTEATRTGIIKNAIDSGYIVEHGKKTSITYNITDKGIYLINTLNKLNIDMYTNKSVDMSIMLNKVYKGELTEKDIIQNTIKEMNEFMSKDVDIEKFEQKVKVFVSDTTWGDIFKKEVNGNVIYTNNDKENPFNLFQKTYVYGTEVKLTDSQVKKLLTNKDIELELYSKSKGKTYHGLISIKGVNDKGYPEYNLAFPKNNFNSKLNNDKVK